MKNERFLSVLPVMLLAVIAFGVRIFYINNVMTEVSIDENVYNAAAASLDAGRLPPVFANGANMQPVYIYSLYIAFIIFGNFTVAGVYLNILYQVVSVLLAYAIIRNISDRYIGFAAGLITAAFPEYVVTVADVTALNMNILIAEAVFAAVIFAGHLLYDKFHNKDRNGEEVHEKKEMLHETENMPVPDASMKEIVMNDADGKINYIENPLPVPKRREHKEMDFAFEPQSGYDDYDLKDMTGMDFYDIE